MPRPHRSNPQTMHQAAELRHEQTPAERKLWAYLRRKQIGGAKFGPQHAIGNYVPNFCCIEKRLIIELDGSQHLGQADYDEERTKFLESQGYRVIRFWNSQVMNDIEGILRTILLVLEES